MAISLGGTHANVAATSAGVASVAVDLPAGGFILGSAGSWLIARVALNNSGTGGAAVTLTVSDARNGSWIVFPAVNRSPNTVDDGITSYVAYVKAATSYANGDDVTFSFSPNCTGYAIVIEQWNGFDPTTPWTFEVASATGGSGTPSVGITPANADVLVYGSLAIEGGGADAYTEDADSTNGAWVTLDAADRGLATANGLRSAGAYKIVTAAGAQTWNPTITSRDWAQQIAIFHPPVVADVLNHDRHHLVSTAAVRRASTW